MENKLNNNIPNKIKSEIIKNGKENNAHVFRIAKSGRIDETTFLNSYDEIRLGLIESKDFESLSEEELMNIGLYGTSCDLTYKKASKTLKMFMRHYPNPIILDGISICGLSQETIKRTGKKSDKNHLDWWIYEGFANNSYLNFKEYIENEE